MTRGTWASPNPRRSDEASSGPGGGGDADDSSEDESRRPYAHSALFSQRPVNFYAHARAERDRAAGRDSLAGGGDPIVALGPARGVTPVAASAAAAAAAAAADPKPEWQPSLFATDAAIRDLYGEPQPQLECFACRHGGGGENAPAVRGRNVEQLMRFMAEERSNANPVQHAQSVSDMYEQHVRQPANANLLPGQVPLPAWLPATVYAHLYGNHTNDAWIRADYIGNTCMDVIQTARSNGLVMQQKTPDGSTQYKIDNSQWKIVKEATDTWLKVMKSHPEHMTGWYHPDRVTIEQRANAGPYVDVSHKRIYGLDRLDQARGGGGDGGGGGGGDNRATGEQRQRPQQQRGRVRRE
jgi:hypothetical protein